MVRVFAKSLNDNSTVVLDRCLSGKIECEKSSPATTFVGSFKASGEMALLGEVEVWCDGKKLFEGRIDRQRFVYGSEQLLQIEARSKGAVLLDNEAKPETLWGANVSTVFARYLGEHGFSLINEMDSEVLSVFTVRKSMCLWEVFCEFVRRLHGVTPYLVGGSVVIERETLKGGARLFSNAGSAGIKFSEYSREITPYNLISKVYLRDEMGEYSSSATNSLAGFYRVNRTRYVIPPTEMLGFTQLDANQKIRAGNEKLESHTLKVPQAVVVDVGDTVEVDLKRESKRLNVEGYIWRFVADEISTTLKLKAVEI